MILIHDMTKDATRRAFRLSTQSVGMVMTAQPKRLIVREFDPEAGWQARTKQFTLQGSIGWWTDLEAMLAGEAQSAPVPYSMNISEDQYGLAGIPDDAVDDGDGAILARLVDPESPYFRYDGARIFTADGQTEIDYSTLQPKA